MESLKNDFSFKPTWDNTIFSFLKEFAVLKHSGGSQKRGGGRRGSKVKGTKEWVLVRTHPAYQQQGALIPLAAPTPAVLLWLMTVAMFKLMPTLKMAKVLRCGGKKYPNPYFFSGPAHSLYIPKHLGHSSGTLCQSPCLEFCFCLTSSIIHSHWLT